MHNTIRYTIIVPSKNLPDLLQRALDSIPVREDVQVLVVDDDSDPAKVDFSAYPGLDRSGTEIIFTNEGKGAGYVRNIGFSRAQGVWTLFLDSDDYFTEGFLEILDRHFEDEADIVYFNVTSAYSETLEPAQRHCAKSASLARWSHDERRSSFYCRYLYTEPWGKMFRTSFLREKEISFDETPIANDFMFSVKSGALAGRTVLDLSIIYCVTVRKGSLSNDFCSTEFQLSTRLGVYYRVQEFLDAQGVRSYPFHKLVNFTLRHRKSLRPVLDDFLKDKGLSRKGLLTKVLFLRLLFSRYHRDTWSIF